MKREISTRKSSVVIRTGNPNAPAILQNAHTAIAAIAKLLASSADEVETHMHYERLTLNYAEMDNAVGKPSFIIALAAMLETSIEFYIQGED